MWIWLLALSCSDAPPAQPPEAKTKALAPAPRPADPATFNAGGTGGPKILLVTLDTVSAGHLASYGGRVPMPVLDALGAVRVEQAFSHFPETALSHWSMMSGVLPEVHGNVAGMGASRYAGPTLAELAKARGYATGAFIGGLTLLDAACGLGRGFDVYNDDMLGPGAMEVPAAKVIRAAGSWIDAQPGPWFAFVHLFDAHTPYVPTAPTRFDPDYVGTMEGTEGSLTPYRDGRAKPSGQDLAHAVALYDAEIAELDAQLAGLFSHLKGDEIVIVTADHGESFAHDYLFNHRAVLWDDVLHVPLYVKAPGLKPQAVRGMVGLVDLLPTLVDLAGWGATAPFQGVSRVGVLRGLGGGAERHWARTDPWMPLLPGEPGARFAERTTTTKRIRELDGSACTYDLVVDPAELRGACGPDDGLAWKAYTDALASMAPFQRRLEPSRPALRATPGELLERLGYVEH